MTGILTDPKVIEAINGLVAVLIAGVGGAAAVGFARLKASICLLYTSPSPRDCS